MSKIAIFSDIHGNIEALSSIIDDIKKENIKEIICLGDVIGIGPKPKECLDIIIENNINMVLGNHELYSLKGTDIADNMSEGEIKHHKWVKKQITKEQRQYLENCNLTIEKEINGKNILFEHFLIDPIIKEEYPFYNLSIIKDESINEIVNKIKYDLVFIGHEHNNFIINNKLYDIGSSGCRKDNKTRYVILDIETFNIKTKIIEYDRKNFEKDLLEKDYPDRDSIAKWFFGINI